MTRLRPANAFCPRIKDVSLQHRFASAVELPSLEVVSTDQTFRERFTSEVMVSGKSMYKVLNLRGRCSCLLGCGSCAWAYMSKLEDSPTPCCLQPLTSMESPDNDSWDVCDEGLVSKPHKSTSADLIELNWPCNDGDVCTEPPQEQLRSPSRQEHGLQEGACKQSMHVVVTDADRKQHFVRCTSRASGVSRATGIESVDSAGATSKSASGASETEESEAYDGFFGSWRRSFKKAIFGTPSSNTSKSAHEADILPEEDFVLNLLELSLAVCDASAEILQEFARKAQQDGKKNYKMLKRLIRLGRTTGLILDSGGGTVAASISSQLPMPVRDLAKAFMKDDMTEVEWVAGETEPPSCCTTFELSETGSSPKEGNSNPDPNQQPQRPASLRHSSSSGSEAVAGPPRSPRLGHLNHSSSVSSQDGTLGLPVARSPRPGGLNHSSSVSSSDGTLGLPRPAHLQHSSSTVSSSDGTLGLPRLLGLNHSTSNVSNASCRQAINRSSSMGSEKGDTASTFLRRQFGRRSSSNCSTGSVGGGGLGALQRRLGLMASGSYVHNEEGIRPLGLYRGTSNASSVIESEGMRKLPFNRSCSNFSNFSCTSFVDFNRKHGLGGVETPSFLQFLATVHDAGIMAQQGNRPRRLQSIKERELDEAFSNIHEVDDMDGHDRMSYHSSQEMGKASVFEMITASGSVTLSTRCLKTQAAWQRSLIEQQRCLLGLVSRKLHKAEEKTRVDTAVSEDQRELLRNFRKIVTKDMEGEEADLQGRKVVVIVVEISPVLRAEVAQLCQLLEYPCTTFGSLKAAAAEISNIMESAGAKAAESPTFLVLLGTAWLDRDLPVQFKQDSVYVTLASQTEELETVGSELCASSDDQIRLLLKERGIREYLLHPLSLEDVRRTAEAALQRRWAEEFLVCETLGRGSSGVVHRVKRLRDGRMFAMKEVPTRLLREKDRQSLLQEVALMQKLAWPTIVSLTTAWENRQQRLHYMVMPFMEGGSLKSRISQALMPDAEGMDPLTRSTSSFSIREKHLGAWYLQCLHGMAYLHSQGVLHRDIKPDNLLLGQGGVCLQICDFGSAMRLPGKGPHPRKDASVEAPITTPLYSAPEVAKWHRTSAASDMWSVGATFYEAIALQTLAPPRFGGPQELGSWLASLADSLSVQSISTVATGSPSSSGEVPSDELRKALEALELTAGIATDYDFRGQGKLEEIICVPFDQRPCAAAILAERWNLSMLRSSLVVSKSTSSDVQTHLKETNRMLRKCPLACNRLTQKVGLGVLVSRAGSFSLSDAGYALSPISARLKLAHVPSDQTMCFRLEVATQEVIELSILRSQVAHSLLLWASAAASASALYRIMVSREEEELVHKDIKASLEEYGSLYEEILKHRMQLPAQDAQPLPQKLQRFQHLEDALSVRLLARQQLLVHSKVDSLGVSLDMLREGRTSSSEQMSREGHGGHEDSKLEAVDLPQRLKFELATGKMSVDLVDDRFDEAQQQRRQLLSLSLHEASWAVDIDMLTDSVGKDAFEWRVEGKLKTFCGSSSMQERLRTSN
eukprot:s323_g15.t1